jgi:hypothetical protein
MICGDIDSCSMNQYNDADSDKICGNVDLCPYDPENDIDEDGKCSKDCGIDSSQYKYQTQCSSIKNNATKCFNSYEISKTLASPCCVIKSTIGYGWTCAPQKFIENKGYRKYASCAAWNITGCGKLYTVDNCPYDAANDFDSDNICDQNH